MSQTICEKAPEPSPNKARYIEEYSKAGFALFRCGGWKLDSKTKERVYDYRMPKTKGWPDIQHTKAPNLPDPCYGVSLKDDDLVLDVDIRRYVDGVDQRKELWKLLGLDSLKELKTLVVRTGGGGLHIYFKKPPHVKVRPWLTKLGFGAIEVKTYGSLVIGAGSGHPSGTPYTIGSGSLAYIAPCPAALLEFIKEPARATGHSTFTSDDKQTTDRYRQLVMATPGAIEGMGGDYETFLIACEGKDYGLSEEKTLEVLLDLFNPRCKPEWSEADLKAKVAHAYKYSQNAAGKYHPGNDFENVEEQLGGWDEPERDAVVAEGKDKTASEISAGIFWDFHPVRSTELIQSINNVVNFFMLPNVKTYANELHGLLRYNIFSSRIEFTRKAPWDNQEIYWTDADTIGCMFYFSNKKHFHVAKDMVLLAAQVVADKNRYHPVQEYLKGIKWDGKPRVDEMLRDYAGAPNTALIREFSKNTMIALVARAMKPGCQHDHMLVLEGPQGTGKTSFCRILGGEWFADIKLNPENKDTAQLMHGKWVIEASEMAFISEKKVEAIKSFITLTHDYIRLPYHRIPMDLARGSGFIGTVNPNKSGKYLTDPTGNRRFWPVMTSKFKLDDLERDRDQLFAEAYARFKDGEKWWITDKELIRLAEHAQNARVEDDAWEEVLSDFFDRAKDTIPEIMSTQFIAYAALQLTEKELNKGTKHRLIEALNKIGYVSGPHYSKAERKTVRGWKLDSTWDM